MPSLTPVDATSKASIMHKQDIDVIKAALIEDKRDLFDFPIFKAVNILHDRDESGRKTDVGVTLDNGKVLNFIDGVKALDDGKVRYFMHEDADHAEDKDGYKYFQVHFALDADPDIYLRPGWRGQCEDLGWADIDQFPAYVNRITALQAKAGEIAEIANDKRKLFSFPIHKSHYEYADGTVYLDNGIILGDASDGKARDKLNGIDYFKAFIGTKDGTSGYHNCVDLGWCESRYFPQWEARLEVLQPDELVSADVLVQSMPLEQSWPPDMDLAQAESALINEMHAQGKKVAGNLQHALFVKLEEAIENDTALSPRQMAFFEHEYSHSLRVNNPLYQKPKPS
jgi:hypothetical protein